MADLQQRSPSEFANSDEDWAPKSERADFAIDRHDTPIRIAVALLYSLAVCLVVIFIWSICTQVPEIAVAPGQVVPRSNVKLIEPAYSGVVEKICVVEGQQVKAGDQLVLLDRVPYLADLEKARRELDIAKSMFAEHQRAIEALNQIINDPAKMPEIQVDIANVDQAISELYKNHSSYVEAQRDIYGKADQDKPDKTAKGKNINDISLISSRLKDADAEKEAAKQTLEKRKSEFLERKNALAIETQSLQQQLHDLKEKRATLELILNQTKSQANDMKTALEAGGLSRLQYLDALKNVETNQIALQDHDREVDTLMHKLASAKSAQLEFESKSKGDLAELQSNVSKSSSEESVIAMQERERQRNMSQADSTYMASMAKARATLAQEMDEMSHQQSRIRQTESQVAAAQNSFDRAVICAPIAGTVTAIKLRGKGEVVNQKDVMMSVVPLVSDLVVEAQLKNEDRGFVNLDQDVKLKFASFPFQDFGILKGKVVEIESSPREINKLGGYYRVLVQPEKTFMYVNGKKIPFSSGMTVSSEIITRYRSIFSIIFDPIRKLTDARWN